MMYKPACVSLGALMLAMTLPTVPGAEAESVLKPGAEIRTLSQEFAFTEGPVSDISGTVYFSDIPNQKIHIWTLDGQLKTFREQSGGANGLYFDAKGAMIACEGTARRLTRHPMKGDDVEVLVDQFEGKKLNSPNDLWIDPQGGIYFTDPRYGNREGMELGEHVYYIKPGGKDVIRVVDDMIRPNGLIGTPDGKLLYITDNGGRKTWVYKIGPDGRLTEKKLFCEKGSDGMTIDSKGNVYLTSGALLVYNPKGELIEEIKFPEAPANVCFGGPKEAVIFVTARKGLYAVDAAVHGVRYRKAQ